MPAAQLRHRHFSFDQSWEGTMAGVRELKVDIGGKKYRIASDDDYLDHIRKGFEPEMVRLFRSVLRSGDTVLDVGANIGCTALLFGETAASVYAFEPSRTTFDFLSRNARASGLPNIHPQNYGLGAQPGEFTLTFAPTNRSGGFVSNLTQASAGHTVETIAIRQLDEVVPALGLQRLDFIKIDVEGFEGEVLKGGRAVLQQFKPTVVLELNHWCLNAFQRTSVPDFFDLLLSIFPVLYAVDRDRYLDLHDESDRYTAMYHHILEMRFPNLLAAFEPERVARFKAAYKRGFK
ncbi:MAG: FkbM family methyltransferase [Aquabacterium sp.]|nr:MAG: FkbM family methyltransferase [Aquabacterium sp.]